MGNVVNKTLETLAEPSLGNPASDGMVLSSTTAGVRSWTAISAGGLTNFTEARTTTAPNATIPVHSIKATGTEANIDFAIVPKGTGAIVAQVPDGAVSGGNKRGSNAVDFQVSRTAADKVASGSFSGILSGQSNKTSGVNAVVGGGQGNTASGLYSSITGGQSNTASNSYAVVGGGMSNTASGENAVISGGISSTAGGFCSVVVGGQINKCDAGWAVICGGRYQRTYLQGQSNTGGYNTSASKVWQDSKLTMQRTTSGAAAVEMFIDSSSIRPVLKNNCAWAFDITILAHSSTNALHTARFKRSGLILRGTTAATTTLEGAVQTIGTDIINSNLAGCAVAITADTTNGSLKVEVTGIAATTIIWQAKIELVEIEI